MQAGDVLLLRAGFIDPPKDKYVICIDPNQGYFFMINSAPWRATPRAQVRIRPHELQCLKHDSYVDTSKIVLFDKSETQEALKDEPWRSMGSLSPMLCLRIKRAVNNHQHLPPVHARLVLDNL